MHEKKFLYRMALPEWGAYAETVVEAWRLFADGYSIYLLSNQFQYYGPMHDGLGCPLFLKPAFRQLSPTWHANMPASEDAIGECLGNHTLAEAENLLSGLCGK